jgi:hypothetical protein
MNLRVIFLVLATLVSVCHASESTIEYSGVQKARSLGGVITDQTGAYIPQVTVQEMSTDWTTVLQTTTTDAHGRWSLPELKGRKTHQIMLVKPGFHHVRFRVRLTRGATKPLDFELIVS